MWRDSSWGWGLASIMIHWISALAIVGLFALGWWMTELSYYDSWYQLGPWWHKSIGMLLLGLSILRVVWRLVQPTPAALGSRRERLAAHAGHGLLYLVVFVVLISGYLISTAEGQGIDVFDLFVIPALISELPNQATLAGEIHWYASWALMILALGHALAAFKHHLFDGNDTLRRMIDPRFTRRSR